MIPRDTIDRIFSAAHIEDVVASYISLKKRGANLIGLCPFHEEKTGSFTVSPSKGIYKCFGCGKSGHVANFIMDIEQCSYGEALKILAKRYGIQIEERELTPEEHQQQDDRESMFVVNDWANKWFQQQLWETDEGKAVGLSYLRERGLRDDIIHKFNIGYSPDKSLLSAEAKKQGFKEKYLVNDSQNAPYIGTGVCLKSEDGRLYDRFHSRVIFPFFSPAGKVIGFAGRLLKQNDKVGKYVNSPTSPLFEKHDCLYGLYQAKQSIVRLNRCYLVEGQMDVISMFQSGIENVVASGGTSLTKPQIRLMHRFTENITVLYDGDKAGIKAALRGIDMILEEGISVKVLLLPDGEDPDSFARTHTAEEFTTYISLHQTDFIRFKIQLLSEDVGQDPIARRELIKSVVQSISVIPDRITREVYLKDAAESLDMQGEILIREVIKLRRERYQQNQTQQSPNIIEQSTTSEDQEEKTFDAPRSMYSVLDENFDKNMLNILQLIIRSGEQPLCQDAEGKPILVGEYIINELSNDGITPRQDVHRQVLADYWEHFHEENFVAKNYFLRHDNSQINHLALDLVADQYQLSKIYDAEPQENLVKLVQRVLLEIKKTVIEERINELQQRIARAVKDKDEEVLHSLLLDQPPLLAIREQIKKALEEVGF